MEAAIDILWPNALDAIKCKDTFVAYPDSSNTYNVAIYAKEHKRGWIFLGDIDGTLRGLYFIENDNYYANEVRTIEFKEPFPRNFPRVPKHIIANIIKKYSKKLKAAKPKLWITPRAISINHPILQLAEELKNKTVNSAVFNDVLTTTQIQEENKQLKKEVLLLRTLLAQKSEVVDVDRKTIMLQQELISKLELKRKSNKQNTSSEDEEHDVCPIISAISGTNITTTAPVASVSLSTTGKCNFCPNDTPSPKCKRCAECRMKRKKLYDSTRYQRKQVGKHRKYKKHTLPPC